MRAKSFPTAVLNRTTPKMLAQMPYSEADTREELIPKLIEREMECALIASRALAKLTRQEDTIAELHDAAITEHMGDPTNVDITMMYEDGTTEEFVMNLSWDALRIAGVLDRELPSLF